MGKTFDEGKVEIAKLCQHFQENKDEFLRPERGADLPIPHQPFF